jgi:hypothetical protein
MVGSGVETGGKALVFETDDGRTFAGAAASLLRSVVFIAFF